MKMRSAIACLMLISGAVLPACRHSADIPVPSSNNNGGSDTTDTMGTYPVDTSLCFERDILPIFISNCAKSGCHDAASHEEGYVLTSYATITSRKFYPGQPGKTEIYKKITDNGKDMMPPPPEAPLTARQIDLIKDWISRGAPNTTGCAQNCDTTRYTFSGAIRPMLDKYCKGCHNNATASGGYSYETYAGVKAAVDVGRLLGSVRHTAGYKAMPQGGNKLSDCEIRQIEQWVEAGANNN